MVRRSVLLAATATMAGAFAPATTGGITRLGMPSRSAVSSLRGGSSRGVSSMQMASAHDFKLPLVGESPRPTCACPARSCGICLYVKLCPSCDDPGPSRALILPSRHSPRTTKNGGRGGRGIVRLPYAGVPGCHRAAHAFLRDGIADRGLHWCAGGGEKSLGDYKGKVVLIENVASL